jgi:two-component system NtrC family sensor kinase
MKSKLIFLIACLFVIAICKAQAPVILDTLMFPKDFQLISLVTLNECMFRERKDLGYTGKEADSMSWKQFSATMISVKNGRAEGWLRLQFSLDSSFVTYPVCLFLDNWMAKDVYLNGVFIASSGNTGMNSQPYQEAAPPNINYETTPLALQPGIVYEIAIHFVDYVSPLNPSKLKSEGDIGVYFAGPRFYYQINHTVQDMALYFTSYAVACLVLCLLFWFLYSQNNKEKVLLLIAFSITLLFLDISLITVTVIPAATSYVASYILQFCPAVAWALLLVSCTMLLGEVFGRKLSRWFMAFILIVAICPVVGLFINMPSYARLGYQIFLVSVYGYLILSSWKHLKGAQWAVVAGVVLTFMVSAVFQYQSWLYNGLWPFPYSYPLAGGIFLSFPVSLMVYVGMRFKEILKEVQKNALEVVQLSEEKKEQAINQQKILELEVARQTVELRTSLEHLKSTQSQLIQSEKMASLGELTAGIAHEIQNPLNFVNNFSEVNGELIEELQGERSKVKGERDEKLEDEIIKDIKANEEKINHHGKRADSIVKGMLEHSKASTGKKELTDINKLTDEYLRLSYHGLRAKDKSFNTEIKTEFDETIGKINIVPQDIGRVLLNLFNNAFYTVNEKAKLSANGYQPLAKVSTKKVNDKIEIRVEDNGNGVPQNIVDKIFQPFFTTKPTGQGTGLGLSLAYDIIKAHGGEIKVKTKEDKGCEFIVQLPVV